MQSSSSFPFTDEELNTVPKDVLIKLLKTVRNDTMSYNQSMINLIFRAIKSVDLYIYPKCIQCDHEECNNMIYRISNSRG